MTQRDSDRRERRGNVDEGEERLARARLAFDQGLREASEKGARAARRLLRPALWGAALIGGTLLAVVVLRMVRRPRAESALLRVSIEPRLESRPLLPALGGALARLAIQRLVAAATAKPFASLQRARSGTASSHAAPSPEFVSSHFGSSNGRAKA